MPLLVLLTTLALPSPRGAQADPVLPIRTARVVDAADILRPNQEQSLNAQLDALKNRSGVEIVVVTLPGLQNYSIEQWGKALGEGWSVGGRNGLGALLIVAPSDREVRIEVGDALNSTLTDSEASTIIQTKIIPQFKTGEMSGGILAGVDAMIQAAMPVNGPVTTAPSTWKPAQSAYHTATSSGASETVIYVVLGVVILLLAMWVIRHSDITVTGGNYNSGRTDDDWMMRRRYQNYGGRSSSYGFGSSASSGSSSSGSSRNSWSGSGSSGSWGSSRSSSSSSSSGSRSSGFSSRGASGRW